MNENEFRTTYHGLNPHRCVYEKSILTQTCHCQLADRINIAERVGIGCSSETAKNQCQKFLSNLRNHASFALKMTRIVGDLLPHSKEIQVQKGGLVGLAPNLANNRESEIESIHDLISAAATSSRHNLDLFPYQKLISSISHHIVAKRSRKNKRP